MEIDYTDYEARVQCGAAWLDENKPDWLQAFAGNVLDGLDMADCCACVLGHVYGDYFRAPWATRTDGSLLYSFNASGQVGFMHEYEALGAAWTEYVGKRLADEGLLAEGTHR